jgi:hypothetical protein
MPARARAISASRFPVARDFRRPSLDEALVVLQASPQRSRPGSENRR